VDFLSGKIPAYVDTGLNVVAVEDVAAGHLLAAEKGKVGERYILGGRNLTLKEILDVLARITGRAAPRVRMPHAVAFAAGCADHLVSRLLGREPRIPLEGVRMARHKMWVDCSKAARELGFFAGSVEAALERAVRWYEDHGYVRGRLRPDLTRAAA
jgi:dihydroflavonol-4-reductase